MLNHENDHIQIDELKICYTTTADNLNDLMSIEIGSFIDLFGYRFYRSVSYRIVSFSRFGKMMSRLLNWNMVYMPTYPTQNNTSTSKSATMFFTSRND